MLYFGDGVPYSYHNTYGQVNPHCKYEFSCHDFPPSCAYSGGLGQTPETGAGSGTPASYLRPALGHYHNPFQQVPGPYVGFFQRRPGRIKGNIHHFRLMFASDVVLASCFVCLVTDDWCLT